MNDILKHLDKNNGGNYVRCLFTDFSSAFNTIIPEKLIEHLKSMHIPIHLCCWMTDFLTERKQYVMTGNNLSNIIVTKTLVLYKDVCYQQFYLYYILTQIQQTQAILK